MAILTWATGAYRSGIRPRESGGYPLARVHDEQLLHTVASRFGDVDVAQWLSKATETWHQSYRNSLEYRTDFRPYHTHKPGFESARWARVRLGPTSLFDLENLSVLTKIHDVSDTLAAAVERVVHHRAAGGGVIVADAGELIDARHARGLHLLRESLLGDPLLEGRVHALIRLLRGGWRLVGDGRHRRVGTVAVVPLRSGRKRRGQRARPGHRNVAAEGGRDEGGQQDAAAMAPQADARSHGDAAKQMWRACLSAH